MAAAEYLQAPLHNSEHHVHQGRRMARRGLLLPLLAALSVLLTAAFVADVLSSKQHASECEMTYSWPVYTPVPWASSHHKYTLFRVDMKAHRRELSGVPVLFVPGHLGSYKQARSIARHLWDADSKLFDVFAVDFREEATGLSGNLVQEQAAFVNDAVRTILKQYKKQAKSARHKASTSMPDAVVIVAHSMGGIVARTAELLPNYKRRSIQHVVGLGVPYAYPPFPFDSELQTVYRRIQADDQRGDRDDSAVYVSIAGGHKDTLVHASLTAPHESSPWVVAALTTAMPTVETTVDHFCLLWCHQLLKAVAGSMHASVDNTTRSFIKDPSERLAIAKEFIFGAADHEEPQKEDSEAAGVLTVETSDAARTLLHREYVLAGYMPTEYANYSLLLPQYLLNLLRARFTSIMGIMYALSLYILSIQIVQWQNKFNLQATAASFVSDDGVPEFSALLHPAALIPESIKSAADRVNQAAFGGRFSSSLLLSAVGAVAVAVIALVTHIESELLVGVQAKAIVALEFAVLCVYAVGMLYTLAHVLWLVRAVVSRVLAATDLLPIPSWMSMLALYGAVFVAGHVEQLSPLELRVWDSSRTFALLVLATFVTFVAHIVVLGGADSATRRDHERLIGTLFATFFLSLYSWVGKVVYLAGMVSIPPPTMANETMLEGVGYILVLALEIYAITLLLDNMVPLPPSAFFGVSSGSDAASLYESAYSSKSSTSTPVKITAENCPKCIFEDGGPGAVLIEYSDRNTRRLKNKTTGEIVVVGPTFRVVSCDCVYRFEKSRDFCDFCVRSCRLCGGGDGNFQQAAKYKEFLEGARTELAMHGLVPLVLQLTAFVLLTYGFQRPHLSFYVTPIVSFVLIVYQTALRSPLEARRRKQNKKKKSTTKKKKTNSAQKSSKTETQTTATTATSTASTAAKKKKKKKTQKASSSTTSATTSSTTSSTADSVYTPLIQEVDPSTLD